MKNVIVVEDRRHLKDLIMGSAKMLFGDVEVRAVETLDQLLRAIKDKQPDLVYLDPGIPGSNRRTIVKIVAGLAPTTRIIVSTGKHTDYLEDLYFKQGAEAVFDKHDLNFQELALTTKLNQRGEISDMPDHMITGLTEAEAKVWNLRKAGKSNGQIADDLRVAERTIKNHVSSINKKTVG